MSTIVTFEDLKTITGFKRANDIENWLRKEKVCYLHSKNGVFTTTDAINAAMGLSVTSPQAKEQDVEIY